MQYLAPDNAKVLAIIGAGVQAVSHIQGLRRVAKFEQVINRCI